MSKLPITLDENYRLEPDGYQWMLKYECKRTEIDEDTLEEKTVTSSDQWYHGELRFALRSYCDKALKPEPNVVALLAAVEALSDKIDKLFAVRQEGFVKRVDKVLSRGVKEAETMDKIIGEAAKKSKYIVGVDPAKEGGDVSTVCEVRADGVVEYKGFKVSRTRPDKHKAAIDFFEGDTFKSETPDPLEDLF
jgi:hypothetical protein